MDLTGIGDLLKNGAVLISALGASFAAVSSHLNRRKIEVTTGKIDSAAQQRDCNQAEVIAALNGTPPDAKKHPHKAPRHSTR